MTVLDNIMYAACERMSSDFTEKSQTAQHRKQAYDIQTYRQKNPTDSGVWDSGCSYQAAK